MPRHDYLEVLEALSGGTVALDGEGTGWPSFGEISLDSEVKGVAIFVGPVGLSHRQRDDVERRFQNPANSRGRAAQASGHPVVEYQDRLSLLVGVWALDPLVVVRHPVVVLADATRRIGTHTRWSVFISLAALQTASVTGWASYTNATGERIYCFHPSLISLAITATYGGDTPTDREIQTALAGTLDPRTAERPLPPSGVEERIRRTVSSLVRDSRFRGQVLTAYGNRCAMCDLSLALVQAAHIYPASAPGSSDHASNGLALCANHHLAFDRHQVSVEPSTLAIVYRPDVRQQAIRDAAVHRFVAGTFPLLAQPMRGRAIDRLMFARRYDYFAGEYSWLPSV